MFFYFPLNAVLYRLLVVRATHNRLPRSGSDLPERIRGMQALVELDLEHNQVKEVPDSVANMPRLRVCASRTERVQENGVPMSFSTAVSISYVFIYIKVQ